MRNLLKVMFVFISLILIIISSGCSLYKIKTQYQDENLEVIAGRNYTHYIFSNKVEVCSGITREDRLLLADREGVDRFYNPIEILTGDFEKIGYNNDMLFILLDNTYYIFDIKSYDISSRTYDFYEYSVSEFEKYYPDYENFDWEF